MLWIINCIPLSICMSTLEDREFCNRLFVQVLQCIKNFLFCSHSSQSSCIIYLTMKPIHYVLYALHHKHTLFELTNFTSNSNICPFLAWPMNQSIRENKQLRMIKLERMPFNNGKRKVVLSYTRHLIPGILSIHRHCKHNVRCCLSRSDMNQRLITKHSLMCS